MSFINPQDKEINCKIVYYGPPFSGKSTNLQQICQKTGPGHRGPTQKIVSLTEGQDRTLFFDFLPLSLGKVGDYKIRIHLYTVPGQVAYDKSRKIILKGVDGIIFVADSQIERLEDDLESWKNLDANLKEEGLDPTLVPIVLQLNKRDLSRTAPVPELRHLFNGASGPEFEAVATQGRGVMETFNAAAKKVLLLLKKKS